MAWFKVDDKFSTSPKVMRLPRSIRLAAVGLWTIAGTWSAKHEQDGRVPTYMLDEWGDDGSLAEALVEVGLWVESTEGFVFHDWGDYQPTRADNDARREAERVRKEGWRRRKAGNTGQSPGNVPDVSQRDNEGVSHRDAHGWDETVPSIPTRPDPTRPDPNKETSNEVSSPQPPKGGERRKKPALPLPSDWEPTREHRDMAAKYHVDLDFEVQQFRAHAESIDRRQVSWNGAFTTWLGKSSQRPRAWTSPPSRAHDRIASNLAVVDQLAALTTDKEITA